MNSDNFFDLMAAGGNGLEARHSIILTIWLQLQTTSLEE